MIIIELSNEQAEMLKVCQENWPDIKKLHEDGFFTLKFGQYIIDKDSEGKIRKTEIRKHHRWIIDNN